MWTRPDGDSKFHRVIDTKGGSSITHCRGRWPVTHAVTLDPNPLWADRCGFCREAAPEPRIDSFDDDRHGAQGEPATGVCDPMKQRPVVDFAWDMTDTETGGASRR